MLCILLCNLIFFPRWNVSLSTSVHIFLFPFLFQMHSFWLYILLYIMQFIQPVPWWWTFSSKLQKMGNAAVNNKEVWFLGESFCAFVIQIEISSLLFLHYKQFGASACTFHLAQISYLTKICMLVQRNGCCEQNQANPRFQAIPRQRQKLIWGAGSTVHVC